jgi:multiple sugar transport system ATP-binding protein
MSSLRIEHVEKLYGPVKVLHGIDLEIRDGEFIVLVGPSGCGKSTLLRMIAGLEEISGGNVLIDEDIVNWSAPKDRGIAMVFQNYALYPHMTVFKNMAFALQLSKRSPDEIRQRVEEAAGILGLGDLLSRYPRELSGGQRQRVAMGRALVRDPKVFLFDEPLSNLDAKLRVQMRIEIKDIQQRLKTTTVYVTHDQVEAMTMADRIVVMNAGVVEQVGSPLDLYDRPANLFVAGFIGSPSMNFINGSYEIDGDVMHFRSEKGISFVVPDDIRQKATPGLGTLGVRPEHLFLSQDRQALEAKIVVMEPTGSETLLVCDHAGQTISVVSKDRIKANAGDSVHIGVISDAAVWFDASGRNLALHD